MANRLRSYFKKHLYRYLREKRISRDARIIGNRELAEFMNGWFDDVSQFTGHADGSVTLQVNHLTISKEVATWLLSRGPLYLYYVALLNAGVTFTCSSQEHSAEKLMAHYEDITFPTNQSGLSILYELLVENTYHYVSNEEPALIFDIGFNVGFASLLFAQQHPNAQLVGFEPFLPIMERAKYNLSLNPTLATRIIPVHVALSNRSRVESWHYSEKEAANSGQFKPNEADATAVPVHLEPATSMMEPYLHQFPNHRVIVKMDCEGGEYDILEDWDQSGFYQNISVLLMEYHEFGGHQLSEIEKWLAKHDFIAHVRPFFLSKTKRAHTGMIIATSSTCSPLH